MPTVTKGRSLTFPETETHGAEHDGPHAVLVPGQLSNAMANGAAASENSTMRTITPLRISATVSQTATEGTSRRFE